MTRLLNINFHFTLLMIVLLAACGGPTSHSEPGQHHDEASADDFERGPHRGRLLREGDFALEITIFESGVPPEFRLFAYRNGQPLPADEVSATVALTRLDGEINRFAFAAQGQALVGDGEVVEPHSFDVEVTAEHAGQSFRWSYASHEGRTQIPTEVAVDAGIRTATAGPAVIHERVRLTGRVLLNADRFAEVRARYPGPVREVRVKLGDQVQAGQVLAVIENRDTLRAFQVTAPFSGSVVARHTSVGDVANDQALFEVADLSKLWVELHAFGSTADRLRPGQPLRIASSIGELRADSEVQGLLPLANAESQSVVVRGLIDNQEGRWRPGLAVVGEVTLGAREVELAVEKIGLQRFRDFTVVFAQIGQTYEVRMLELGVEDDRYVEVLGGLKPGTTYVTEQSFLIKADIEKSGASHDH